MFENCVPIHVYSPRAEVKKTLRSKLLHKNKRYVNMVIPLL